MTERLVTALGRHAVDALVPFDDARDAREALARAVEIASRLAARDSPPLAGAVEVRSWLGGFFSGEHQVQTRELSDLKRLIRAETRCANWLNAVESCRALVSFAARFPRLVDVVEELEAVVDDRGEVLDSASVRLAAIRRDIDAADSALRVEIARFVADDDVRRCLQSPEPTWRHGRPVFQVKAEMRARVPGVLHDRSQSGATVFMEPASIVEAANRLADLRADEHREIEVILAHVSRGLRRCRADIDAAVHSMAELDVAMARARLVNEEGFIAPEVVDDGPIHLRGAVHPLLWRTCADRSRIVPLDLTLGDPFRILVVTGPNTGGKTVALKTVGLLVAMAMAGMPIPAHEGTRIRMLDGVFVDVGDEQGIRQNLSTFSSHVTRIVRCLAGATRQSLVLLDELGAGTDPEEGSALGYAVLEELHRRGSLCVITTHMGRLKQFAYEHASADNGAMAFDGATLAPLYRLDVGIPGTSHALDIASRVGMPAGIVARARELIGSRDDKLDQVIASVHAARQRAEADRQGTERLNREAAAAGAELAERRRTLERERAWLHEEAGALVEAEFRSLREHLAGILRPFLNAPRPYGDDAKRLLESLELLLRSAPLHRRRMAFVGKLRKDDVVYLPRLGKRCAVRRVDREREVLTVEVGKLRMEVPFEDVSWLEPVSDGAGSAPPVP